MICIYSNSCCTARTAVLPSCSNPLTQFQRPSTEDFCPTPPLISIDSNKTRALESKNTYVAEQLLRKADGDDPAVFFRRYQAGIAVSYRDPPYSVCGCFEEEDDDTCEYIDSLMNIHGNTSSCPNYLDVTDECILHLITSKMACPRETDICSDTLPGCYNIDGESADTLQQVSCADETQRCGSGGELTVGATYPKQQKEMAVTVWYNNQVCIVCLPFTHT